MPHTHNRYDYWFAEVDNSFCYSNGVDLVKSCIFYFAFCGALPVKKTKEISHGCLGSSVCQTGLVEHGLGYKEFTYSMGRFETFTRFFFSKLSGRKVVGVHAMTYIPLIFFRW